MVSFADGEAVDRMTGGDAVGGNVSGGGPGALREDLLDLLRQKEVRRKLNEALLREAVGETKSTGVIRAYELVQKILQDAGEDAPVEELDLRQFSDSALRCMVMRIRREEDKDSGRPEDGAGDGYGQSETT